MIADFAVSELAPSVQSVIAWKKALKSTNR